MLANMEAGGGGQRGPGKLTGINSSKSISVELTSFAGRLRLWLEITPQAPFMGRSLVA